MGAYIKALKDLEEARRKYSLDEIFYTNKEQKSCDAKI